MIRVGISISPRNLPALANGIDAHSLWIADKFLNKVKNNGIRAMQHAISQKTKIRSGTMYNSVTAIVKRKSSDPNSFDRRANIDIIVDPVSPRGVHYADYVDRGTRERPGAFVPRINKNTGEFGFRIKSGIFPGIKARRFTAAAARVLTTKVGQKLPDDAVNSLTQAFKRSSLS